MTRDIILVKIISVTDGHVTVQANQPIRVEVQLGATHEGKSDLHVRVHEGFTVRPGQEPYYDFRLGPDCGYKDGDSLNYVGPKRRQEEQVEDDDLLKEI